jgi:hypothetical protein
MNLFKTHYLCYNKLNLTKTTKALQVLGLLVLVQVDLVVTRPTDNVLTELVVVAVVDDSSLDVTATDLIVPNELRDGEDLGLSDEHGRAGLSSGNPSGETLSLQNVAITTDDGLGAVGALLELTIKVGGVLGERWVEVQAEHGISDGEANVALNPGHGVGLEELLVKVGGEVRGAAILSVVHEVSSPTMDEATVNRQEASQTRGERRKQTKKKVHEPIGASIVGGREHANSLSKARVQLRSRVNTKLEKVDSVGGHGESTSAVLQHGINLTLGVGEGTREGDARDLQTSGDGGGLDDGLKVVLSALEETDSGIEDSTRSRGIVQLIRDYTLQKEILTAIINMNGEGRTERERKQMRNFSKWAPGAKMKL